MTRTTAEWEELLDGTTPGPWTPGAYPAHIYEVVDTDLGPDFGRRILTAIIEDGVCDFDKAEANANLACEAHDAVTEVIRLRTELEALRRITVMDA